MSPPKIFVRGGDAYFLADIPALPGCVASGATRGEAVARVRTAFGAYRELLESRGVSTEHVKDVDPATLPVEELPVGVLLPGDEAPLEEHEVRDFLHQFEASRAALLALVRETSPAELERKPTEAAWSVRQTLEHVMTGEALIFSRLEKWPDDPFNMLQAVHRVVFQRISVMEPGDTERKIDVHGRPQTVRKVMRALLEHEYEHYGQIREILAALGADRPPE